MRKIASLVAVLFAVSAVAGCTPGHFRKATGVHVPPGQAKKH